MLKLYGSARKTSDTACARMASSRVPVLPATAYAGVRAAELANAQASPWLLRPRAHS